MASVSLLLLVRVSQAFQPAASPRFDVFLDNIVGSWWLYRPVVTSDHGVTKQGRGEVEEVMRSCGGAVQGIREIGFTTSSTTINDNDSNLYLNRADDGFVFHDNGSYSVGPTTLDTATSSSDSNSAGHACWMTSLSLNPSCRILIQEAPISGLVSLTGDEETQTLATQDTDSAIRYMAFVRGEWKERPLDISVLAQPSMATEDTIQWKEQLRCRMPSPNQPWMRQRLKWESDSTTTAASSDGDIQDPEASSVEAWVWRKELEDGTTRILTGAASAQPSTVVAFCREYQPNGCLSSVTWMRN